MSAFVAALMDAAGEREREVQMSFGPIHRVRRVLVATVAALVGFPAAFAGAAALPKCTVSHWVGAWELSPTDALPGIDGSVVHPELTGSEQTYRVIATPHLAGSRIRIHLSNRFGHAPVTFTHVTVGIQSHGASIEPGTLHTVTFGRQASTRVPAGSDAISDPILLTVGHYTPVAVSIYVKNQTTLPTEHWLAEEYDYYTPPGGGDQTADTTGHGYTQRSTNAFFLDGLDVTGPARVGSVVALGDSITEGFVAGNPAYFPEAQAINDQNQRWTDYLQRRLYAAGTPLSVLNAGNSGGRLLRPGFAPMFGPSGLARVGPDVIAKGGVSTAIILLGINDIGFLPFPTPAGLEAGYATLIKELHAAGIKVLLGTIMPSGGSILDGISDPNANEIRTQTNDWIRSQHLSDGVIDFDAITRDPANPNQLNPAYNAPGDKLHPDPTGYAAMANGINLSQLARPRCDHTAKKHKHKRHQSKRTTRTAR